MPMPYVYWNYSDIYFHYSFSWATFFFRQKDIPLLIVRVCFCFSTRNIFEYFTLWIIITCANGRSSFLRRYPGL